MTQFVPWKCNCCGREFDMSGGGLCKKCGKPTCGLCFGIGALKRIWQLKMPESRLCRRCAKAEEPKANGPA